MVDLAPREPTMSVAISWNGSGLFDGAYDELRPRLLQGSLTCRRGRDAARPLAGPMLASVGWRVHNQDRLLSPEWPGSGIYGEVEPGKPMRVEFTVGDELDYDADIDYDADVYYSSGGETLPVAMGVLGTPEQQTTLGQYETGLSGNGAMARLREQPISTAMYSNIRTDEAIGHVLDAAGWPAADRVISIGDSTLEWWWLDEEDALTALDDLLATEGAPAAMYEDALGRIRFENRNYRGTQDRSTEVQAVFSDKFNRDIEYDADIDYDDPDILYDAGAELMHSGVDYAPDYEQIWNEATVVIQHRELQSSQKVWEYGAPLVLSAGETRTITVTTSDPFQDQIAPASGTDYTVAAGSLASTPTLTNVYAQRMGVTFVAGAGGATVNGVTSNGPQIRAKPITVLYSDTVKNDVDASDSIAKYSPQNRPRTLSIPARSALNKATALAVANAAVTQYKDQHPILRLVVFNIDGEHLRRQLISEISDQIAIISDPLGLFLGGEVYIEQIEHQRVPGALRTTFVCERLSAQPGGALWDDGIWDSGLWAA